MILYCPRVDDVHAAGPHRVVIPVSTLTRRYRDGNGRICLEVCEVVGTEFGICAHCDHWTRRLVDTCKCECHLAQPGKRG